MKEYLQIRPHLLEMLLTRHFHHTVQYGEHPRRYTTDVRHVLIHRLTGYALAFEFEITEQGCLLLRHAHQIGQRIDILNQNGTEVAHQRILQIIVGSVTATKDETSSVEHTRLGVVPQIQCHYVASASIVNLLQAFLANGNKLRLIVRRTARLGIPLDAPWPQDILFPMTHTVYLAFQFLIAVHWT